ncbi:DUF2240 family protein [Halegenticoccus tardaugens]|uniref:DUF2240 family protein n=1 Tax=Halegenticoccus tardaugens TaxID=2071624 RepID=UPI00100AEEA6|nr:DUF2240 family protein [Halegenticoccus tardaugens]
MSLERAVAAPFRQRGKTRMGEGEFVVALSLDNDWFSPDQAKRLVDVAVGRDLLSRDGTALEAAFDPSEVEVPAEFVPDESVLREQSTFERLLDALVAAGVEKQTAVAAINARQHDLGVTLEAAAVVYARSRGVDVGGLAADVREGLRADDRTDADDGTDADDRTRTDDVTSGDT